MAPTLKQRLERSQIRKQIAENEAAERRAKNFLNENLKNTRKRKLGWTEPGRPERDLTSRDRRAAMAMARQKVEESPIAAAIINARLDNIVGSGFRLMMRSGNIDWYNAVEDWWSDYKDKMDIRGVRPWQELLRCWQARHDIDGDVGILMVADMFDDVPQSWVQTIEADRIAKDAVDLADTGVEFDRYGMPKAFYVLPYDPKVTNPNDSQTQVKPIRYNADNFILYINDGTYRANRARGVTSFLQAFNILKDHEEIMDGIVQKVKNEAFIGLKFFMEGNEDGNVFGDQAQRDATMENGVDYSKVKIVPGMNLVLGEGENVDVLESKSPHSEFDAFEKKLISRIAMPFGFSYELITGDFSAMNDRTARVQLKQFEKRIRREQNQLGFVASRVFQWALSRAVKYGELNPPAGVTSWWNHRWGRPGFPYINILQEAQANILLLEKGLTSRTKILAEQGDDDFEDLMNERAYEQDVMQERAIEVTESAPAMASMHAAALDEDNPRLTQSEYKVFDYGYASRLKESYPEIWGAGGNIRGGEAFEYWGKYRNGDRGEGVIDWVKEREAWAARHYNDGSQFKGEDLSPNLSNVAGIIAQIKWGVVGNLGESRMKSIIDELKEKREG